MLAAALTCGPWPAAADSLGRTVEPELRSRLKRAIEDTRSFKDRFHAEVWLRDMAGRLRRFVDDPEYRLELLERVHREATRVDLPPELVLAVIHVESRFDRFAVSRAGAQGLMQVMPFWLEEIGHPEDNLIHMDTNLRLGCTILRYYLDQADGAYREALARYHGSWPARHYADKVLDKLSNVWFRE